MFRVPENPDSEAGNWVSALCSPLPKRLPGRPNVSSPSPKRVGGSLSPLEVAACFSITSLSIPTVGEPWCRATVHTPSSTQGIWESLRICKSEVERRKFKKCILVVEWRFGSMWNLPKTFTWTVVPFSFGYSGPFRFAFHILKNEIQVT